MRNQIQKIKGTAFLLLIFLFVNLHAFAALRVAVQSGDWTDSTTWQDGTIPAMGDDVVIPAGITVSHTGTLNNNNFFSLEVSGKLSVTENITFNQWDAVSLTVKSGGVVDIGADLSFQTGNNNMKVSIEKGGELYIGGEVNHGTPATRYIYNSGYIEINGSINKFDGTIYNYENAVMYVHGNIEGANTLYFYNSGVLTVDKDMLLDKTRLYNYETGKVIVFGTLVQGEGSQVHNSGLLQVVNYTFNSNATLLNNEFGTIIVQEVFTVIGGHCPACPDKIGEFFYGSHVIPSTGCDGYASCADFFETGGKPITLGRRLWLSSTFIGYGQSLNGDKVNKWFDLANSFGFQMAQPNEAQQPTIKNNAIDNINFNYVVDFSGANVVMDMSNKPVYIPAVDNGMAVMGVVVPASSGSADQAVFDFGLYNTDGYGFMYSDQNIRTYTATNHGGVENEILAHSYGTTPTIITQMVDLQNSQTLSVNGVEVDDQAISLSKLDADEVKYNDTPTGDAGPFTLGAASADISQFVFDGKIAELIVYAHLPTAAVVNSTESFLALKYGITKPADYTDYFGNVVYATNTYNNGIIGIAREDLNLLNQKQSRSILDPLLTISISPTIVEYDQRQIATQIAGNTSYFICGHDANAIPADRVYKVQTTNFAQEVTLQFSMAGLTAPYPQLLVDDNDSFSSATTVVGTYADDKLTFTHLFSANTSYFKLETLTPLPQIPGVGINTESIDATAELHIVSANKGILLPALPNAAAITETPTQGLLFYNTTHKRFMYYDGSNWKFVGEPLKQTDAEFATSTGSYIGEIRYNTTTKTMWIWNGTTWLQLKNN